MNINLTQPVCFLDLETTGLNRQTDRIIEICIIKLMPNGEIIKHTKRLNPQMPIAPEASEVNKIYDADVANCPTFTSIAPKLYEFIKNCDIVGYGSNYFDVPILYAEFLRAGIEWDYANINFIDAGNIYKIQNPRTLSAAFLHYTGKEHTEAHGAQADTEATMEVFMAQIATMEGNMKDIALYSNYDKEMLDISGNFAKNKDGEIIFNFGKNKGMIAKNDPNYLNWMLNSNFNPDTKEICKKLLVL